MYCDVSLQEKILLNLNWTITVDKTATKSFSISAKMMIKQAHQFTSMQKHVGIHYTDTGANVSFNSPGSDNQVSQPTTE